GRTGARPSGVHRLRDSCAGGDRGMSPEGVDRRTDGPPPPRRPNAGTQPWEPEDSILSGAGADVVASNFSPDWEITPGEILQAELDARNLTQAELALRTGLTP